MGLLTAQQHQNGQGDDIDIEVAGTHVTHGDISLMEWILLST